jgi:Ribosomal protein S17
MKIFKGKVVANSGQNTIKVEVERVVTHPVYGKRLKRVKKYLVHDELGHKLQDVVSFAASKPYSKMKKWKVVDERPKNKKV